MLTRRQGSLHHHCKGLPYMPIRQRSQTPTSGERRDSRPPSWAVATRACPAEDVKMHLDLVHDWRNVGQRLAGAGWGAGQHIAARQQDRYNRLLDARRRAEVDGCSAGSSEVSTSHVGSTAYVNDCSPVKIS